MVTEIMEQKAADRMISRRVTGRDRSHGSLHLGAGRPGRNLSGDGAEHQDKTVFEAEVGTNVYIFIGGRADVRRLETHGGRDVDDQGSRSVNHRPSTGGRAGAGQHLRDLLRMSTVPAESNKKQSVPETWWRERASFFGVERERERQSRFLT